MHGGDFKGNSIYCKILCCSFVILIYAYKEGVSGKSKCLEWLDGYKFKHSGAEEGC